MNTRMLRITIRKSVENLLAQMKLDGRAQATIDNNRNQLIPIVVFFEDEGKPYVDQIDTDDLNRYVSHVIETPTRAGTKPKMSSIRTLGVVMKKWTAFCFLRRYVKSERFYGYRVATVKIAKKMPPTFADYAVILAIAEPFWDEAINPNIKDIPSFSRDFYFEMTTAQARAFKERRKG